MFRFLIDIHIHPFLFGLDEAELLNEIGIAGLTHAVLVTPEYDVTDYEKFEVRERVSKLIGIVPPVHPTVNFQSPQQAMEYLIKLERSKWTAERVISFLMEMAKARGKQRREERVAQLIKRYPDKLIWFGSINPNRSEEYVKKKLENMDNLGWKGLKLLPTFQLFKPAENENFKLICKYCEKTNKPVLYHTGCDPGPFEIFELSENANPKNLEPVLKTCRPPIILAHIGSYSAFKPGIWFDEALDIMKRYENVYADTSAVGDFIYFNKTNVEKIRKMVGFDRILFGSDFPAVEGSTIDYEVSIIKTCPYLSEEEKMKILGLNAARLLGIK